MKKFFCLLSVAVLSANVFANLFKNGDFADGYTGYGFSDASPESVGAKISQMKGGGNFLTYTAKTVGLGGLNFSEVKLDKSKTYVITFKAKASRGAKIRLIAFANGNSIYRRELALFDIGKEWKDCSFKLSFKAHPCIDEWVPFRIERADEGEVSLSFADFKIVAEGEAEEPAKFSLRAEISRDIGAVQKLKNMLTGKCDSRAPIFDKGADMTVALVTFNPAAVERDFLLKWKIVKLSDGETVSKGDGKFIAKSGRSRIEIMVAAPAQNGVYAFLPSVDGIEYSAEAFAVSPRVRAGAGTLPIDIGYCGVLTNGESGAPTLREMAFLADSGISYIRTWDGGNPFNWRVIEPKENKYYWEITDATVKFARKQGLKVLPVLGGMFFIYPPEMGIRGHRQADWLYAKSEVVRTKAGFERQGRQAIKPPMEDWNRMVRAISERYKGKIRQYEIMNEPNIIWRDYATYYPYLESAHKILKEVDKKNRVVGLSTTGDYGGDLNGFVNTMLKMGAGKLCDAISFHSYGSLFEDSAKNATDVIEIFKADLAKYDVKAPLWHSELYYLNPQSKGGGQHEIGPVFHAGYLIRRYLLDAASGVEVSTILPARFVMLAGYSGQKMSNFVRGRSVPSALSVADNPVPNEKYVVSAVFAQQLFGMKFTGRVPLRERILAYTFAGRKSENCAATIFALDAELQNLDLNRNFPKTQLVDKLSRKPIKLGQLPSGIKLFDVYGNEIIGGEDGVTLPISPLPVYVQAPDKAVLDEFLKRLM